jgi:hypothetical protein
MQRQADALSGRSQALEAELGRIQIFLEASRASHATMEDEVLNATATSAEERPPPTPLRDGDIVDMARLIWLGSLSSSDLASMGMIGNTDPYSFRKLVFWTSASNIDLGDYASEIDGVIDNTVALAEIYRNQNKARKARNQARNKGMKGMIDQLVDPTSAAGLHGIIDMLVPVEAEAAPGSNPAGGTP